MTVAQIERAVLEQVPLPASRLAITAAARRRLRGPLDTVIAQALRKAGKIGFNRKDGWSIAPTT